MPEPADLPDYALRNRAVWTISNARFTAENARDSWAQHRIYWGVFKVPEDEVQVLPDERGLDVIELGCGTAYFGAWFKKGGARRVVGVDITPAQLDSARRLNTKYGVGLELVEANAEATGLPVLRRIHVGGVGADVAVRRDVARAKATLKRRLIRAPPALRRADYHRAASTVRLPTRRSERWDLRDEIVTQTYLAAELVWNPEPSLLLDDGARTKRYPAIGEAGWRR